MSNNMLGVIDRDALIQGPHDSDEWHESNEGDDAIGPSSELDMVAAARRDVGPRQLLGVILHPSVCKHYLLNKCLFVRQRLL